MRTVNDCVAVTPFETTSVRVEVKNGVAVIKQKKELTRLEVVLDSDDGAFVRGSSVWVRGECMKHEYAKEIFENDGLRFVLIPRGEIRAVESASLRPPAPAPTTVPSAGVPRQDDGRR